jgi:ABC-type branched-subunit amino acid transport system ATPase component
MTAELLALSHIQHSFRGLHVLKGVDLAVPPGSFVALIGPNGAGKSTLFNIASGFLRPEHGAIRLDGADIADRSVQARTRLGLVRTFQTPQVFGGMTVTENLMVGLHRHTRSGLLGNLFDSPATRRDRAYATAAAGAVLERFGLTAVADRNAGSLPGGLQRMVELARAYLCGPRILLLDEPSSGLNSDEIGCLASCLHALHAEGIAILLVSHDMDLVGEAQRIHVLCFGEIIASGGMDDIRADARVREAYLGA